MRIALFTLFLFCLDPFPAVAQYTSAKDSDPEALALLRKAAQPFASGHAQLEFTLKVSFPGEEPITTPGMLWQSGQSFHLDLRDYAIISDGTTRWVYLKDANEVNIYSAKDAQDWLNPQDFLTLHKAPDLVFVQAGTRSDGMTVIEAKPLQGRFSDYSKFSIHLKGDKLAYILALGKDGTRQELTLGKMSFPASLDAQTLFRFHPAQYPGVHIEDLRID